MNHQFKALFLLYLILAHIPQGLSQPSMQYQARSQQMDATHSDQKSVGADEDGRKLPTWTTTTITMRILEHDDTGVRMITIVNLALPMMMYLVDLRLADPLSNSLQDLRDLWRRFFGGNAVVREVTQTIVNTDVHQIPVDPAAPPINVELPPIDPNTGQVVQAGEGQVVVHPGLHQADIAIGLTTVYTTIPDELEPEEPEESEPEESEPEESEPEESEPEEPEQPQPENPNMEVVAQNVHTGATTANFGILQLLFRNVAPFYLRYRVLAGGNLFYLTAVEVGAFNDAINNDHSEFWTYFTGTAVFTNLVSFGALMYFARGLTAAEAETLALRNNPNATPREIEVFRHTQPRGPTYLQTLFRWLYHINNGFFWTICFWQGIEHYRLLEGAKKDESSIKYFLLAYTKEVMESTHILLPTKRIERLLSIIYTDIFGDIQMYENLNKPVKSLGKALGWRLDRVTKTFLQFNLQTKEILFLSTQIQFLVEESLKESTEKDFKLYEFVSMFLARCSLFVERHRSFDELAKQIYKALYSQMEDSKITSKQAWESAKILAMDSLLTQYHAHQIAYLAIFEQEDKDNIKSPADLKELKKKYFFSALEDLHRLQKMNSYSAEDKDNILDDIISNRDLFEKAFFESDPEEYPGYLAILKKFEAQNKDTTPKVMKEIISEAFDYLARPIINENLDKMSQGELDPKLTYTFSLADPTDITPIASKPVTKFKTTIKNPPKFNEVLGPKHVLPLENVYPSNFNPSAGIGFNPQFVNLPHPNIGPKPKTNGLLAFISWVGGLVLSCAVALIPPLNPLYNENFNSMMELIVNGIYNGLATWDNIRHRRLLAAEDWDQQFESLLSSSNITDENTQLFAKLLYKRNVQDVLIKAQSQNATKDEALAQILSQFSVMQNSLTYQEMLQSQYGLYFDKPDAAAAELFRQVQNNQSQADFKTLLNQWHFEDLQEEMLSNGRLLAEDESIYYYEHFTRNFDDFVVELNLKVFNFNQLQWKTLQVELNNTISSYVVATFPASKIPPVRGETFFYHYLGFGNLQVTFSSSNHEIQVTFYEIDVRVREILTLLIKNTLADFFYISVDIDKKGLTTSASKVDIIEQNGIEAIFKSTQIEEDYYQVDFDGSFSYNLWDPDYVNFIWDFGDNTTAKDLNLKVISHKYTKAGKYYPKLRIQDMYGHYAEAQATIPITVLYSLQTKYSDGDRVFISSRDQYWMFVAGNVYEPISPFVTGANQATLFNLNVTASNEVMLNPISIDGQNLTGNYLGLWGYPSPSPLALQASFYNSTALKTKATWKVVPIGDGTGYFALKQDGKYLSIKGELTSVYNKWLCDFTFVNGSLDSRDHSTGQLFQVGKKPISNVQIKNYVNSNSNNPIKISNPSTGNNLFNLMPAEEPYSSSYFITDFLNQEFVLSKNGDFAQVAPKITPVSPQQLWTPMKATVTEFILQSREDSEQCLVADFKSNSILTKSCISDNTDFCYDDKDNYIYSPKCKIINDQWCCKSKWYWPWSRSCELCPSKHVYCPDALDEGKIYKERIGFSKEHCRFDYSLTDPLATWRLYREDASIAAAQDKAVIETFDRRIPRMNLFNVGFGKYLCPLGRSVSLFNSPCHETPWKLRTFSIFAELDIPGSASTPNAGYYFENDNGDYGKMYLTGQKDKANDNLYFAEYSYQVGHFWKIRGIGYNVYQLVYGWGNGDTHCLTALSFSEFKFIRCDPDNKAQYWYFERN